MDKRDWYKGQYPTGDEMDELLALTEAEIGLAAKDVRGTKGLLSTAIVAYENAAPDNNVRIPIGAALLDRSGSDTTQVVARWGSIQTVDCSVDYLSASTQPGGGKERYLAVFVKYDETLADARTDYDGNPIDYEHNASFEFEVHQTGDAAAGTATPVADPGDEFVRVCDILVTNAGWGTIVDPVDPEIPGDDEIDYTSVTFLTPKEIDDVRYGKRTLLDAVEGGFGGRIHTDARRQAILNGDFNLNQRNFGVGVSGNGYNLDRWYQYEDLAATGMWTGSRNADSPTQAESGVKTEHAYRLVIGGAQAVILAAERAYIEQRVEGLVYRALAGRHATLSFWIKTATFTGTLCVAFQNRLPGAGNDASYVIEYTISSAGTWEKKTIEVLLDESVGTWIYDRGIGLRVVFAFAVGANGQTTPGAWQNTNAIGTSGMGNGFDNVANEFKLAQVQLNGGRLAMPYLTRSAKEELALCQRYYEKSHSVEDQPGAAGEVGGFRAHASKDNEFYWHAKFATEKRTTPTVTPYSPVTATAAKLRDVTGGADIAAVASTPGTTGSQIFSSDAGVDVDDIIAGHWTADAEL